MFWFIDDQQWSGSNGLNLESAFEVQSLRIISRKLVGEPYLVWSDQFLSALGVVMRCKFVVVFFPDPRPRTPKKGFIKSDDRQLDDSSQVELVVANHAIVRSQM